MAYLTDELTVKTFDKRIPFDVSLELTRKCNLNCTMCYQLEKDGIEMDTRTIKKVLDILADAQCLFCTFTGGEPLLRNDTVDLIDYATNNGFAVTLKTNGTLLDADIISKISAAGVMEVHLSLLGGTARVHDRITGIKGSFEKTIKALENLQKTHVTTVIMSVITPESLSEMELISNLVKSAGIEHLNFSSIIFPKTPGDPAVNIFRLSEKQLEQYYDTLEHLSRYDTATTEIPSCEDERLLSCTAIQSGITINPDGTVIPCSAVPVALGNITTDSLESILFSPIADIIIEKLQLSSTPVCNNCVDNRNCIRCPGLGYMDNGMFSGIPVEACKHTRAFKNVHGL